MNTQKRIVERMLDATKDIWQGYLEHPFILGIADGSLDVEKFRYYLTQDYVYLLNYAKIYAHTLVHSKDPAVMAACAQYINVILCGEMTIHKGYMERMGISLEQAQKAPASMCNTSYTSYMRAVAAEGTPAEGMTATLPCALSYEFIGTWIAKNYPDSVNHPFYGEWVRAYSDPAYTKRNEQRMTLMDEMTKGATEEELQNLIDIFVTGSKYEAMFWDMGWTMGQ